MARPSDPRARIELLRAAEAVFVEHGLEGAKVEEITRRAGRSKGSFYLHFASKEDAFRQIVESMVARLAAIIDAAQAEVAASDEPIAEAWLRADLELFEFLWRNRGVASLCLSGGGGAAFAYLVDELAERARVQSKSLLADGIRRGIYRDDLDLELTSLVVAGAYDRLARDLVRMRTKPDLRRWLAQAQKVLLCGIASDAVVRDRDSPVNLSPGPDSGRRLRTAAARARSSASPNRK